MINLDTVKPGDVLSYRGERVTVSVVNLHRKEDLSTELATIGIMFPHGGSACLFPYAFKSLEYWKEPYLNTKVKFVGFDASEGRYFTYGKVYDVVDGKLTDNKEFTVPMDGAGFKSMDDLHKFFAHLNSLFAASQLFGGKSEVHQFKFEEVKE